MAMKQEVNVPLIGTIGAVSIILLVVICVGTNAWYLANDQQVREEQAEQFPDMAVKTLQSQQMMQINAPAHWVDAGHTLAAIPIEDAMKMVVATQGKIPVGSAATDPMKAAPPMGRK